MPCSFLMNLSLVPLRLDATQKCPPPPIPQGHVYAAPGHPQHLQGPGPTVLPFDGRFVIVLYYYSGEEPYLGALLGEVVGHVAHGNRLVERRAERSARHLADLPPEIGQSPGRFYFSSIEVGLTRRGPTLPTTSPCVDLDWRLQGSTISSPTAPKRFHEPGAPLQSSY
jgi:hypothetical protein